MERRVTRIVVVTYVAVLQPTVGEVWQRLAHALGGFHACAATDELRGRQLGRVLLLVELGHLVGLLLVDEVVGVPLGEGHGGLLAHAVLATLAAVALAVDAVQGHRDRLVALPGQSAERHAARDEAAHDGLDGLHLVHAHRLPARCLGGHELQKVA